MSQQKELEGLFERGVFQTVEKGKIPIGTRIFGSHFVDTIKFDGTEKAIHKSRLVAQAFNDLKKKQTYVGTHYLMG